MLPLLFERLYTLIGEEYSLILAVDDSDFARSSYRPILKAARSLELKFIKGPVVTFDIPPLNIERLKSSSTGKPLLILAIVTESNNFDLSELNNCSENPGFQEFVTGGYIIFSKKGGGGSSSFKLCEYNIGSSSRSKISEREKPQSATPKFLVGDGGVLDDILTISYAVRIRRSLTPQSQASPSIVSSSQLTTEQWEKLIRETVEREVGKLIVEREEVTQIDLGEGLIAKISPEMVRQISIDPSWHSVFTHQSVDPTPHRNYESKETLGDSVLSLVLTHHLLSSTNKRRSDSNSITDIRKVILADNRQTDMSITMGLDHKGLIRSSVGVDSKMLEDVFEAFFGCLFTVSNKVNQNSGLSICEALLCKILEESSPELNLWSIGKDSPTVLEQLFKKMQWEKPIFIYNDTNGTTTINFTREAYSFLQTLGPPFKFGVPLVVGPKSSDLKSSKKAAATLALSALKLIWGIDSKYTDLQVRNRLLTDPKYAAAHREAMKIAKKLGYSDVYVMRRAKHNNQLYAVMGVRKDDEEEEQLFVYKYEKPEVGGAAAEKGDTTRVLAYITALKRFVQQQRDVHI